MGKLKDILRVDRSFSKKMILYIMGLTAILFITSITIVSVFSYNLIRKEAQSKAFSILKSTNQEIENILVQVSVAVDNLATDVLYAVTSPDRDHEEDIYRLTRRLVEENDYIVGSCIALEPYFYKNYKYFAPYSHQTGKGIVSFQSGTEDYDYPYMDWYQIPKLLGKSYWTDPFFDEGAGNIVMCTYTHPIFDENHRFLGVLTADLQIDRFTRIVSGIKTYEHAYNMMIGKGATFIVHPRPEKIFNETIFSATIGAKDSVQYHIGQEMIHGKTGMKSLRIEGRSAFVFYSPIPSSGWSVAIVCPHNDIYAGVIWMGVVLGLVAILGLALLFLIIRHIVNKLTRPLSEFAVSARSIAQGDFKTRLPVITTGDEMQELHESFDYMQNSLTRYIDELKETTSAKEKIESELNIARKIQMDMLPKIFPPFPERHDLDIYAMLKPAKEVGGDLYDFFINDNHLYFTIGDVSGKGVPASLLMAVTRSLFRSVSTSDDPAYIVSYINSALAETNESNMFVTMFVGILDLEKGDLRYCNAGHNPPFLLRNGKGEDRDEVEIMDMDPNLPVGLFDDFKYNMQVMHLDYDTSIFLYTDGLTEAENREKELFGEERAITALQEKGTATMTSTQVLNKMFNAVEAHVDGNQQSDDLTMLVIKYRDFDPDPAHRVLVIKNQVSELNRLTEFIDGIAGDYGFDPTLAMNLNLVMEEAVSNVIFYAYPKGENHHTIKVEFRRTEQEMQFMLYDHGVAFDPTKAKDADVTLSAEERKIGGLGIFLMKQLMDSVQYKREKDTNILIMRKKININLKHN